jgi:hypothetical protein
LSKSLGGLPAGSPGAGDRFPWTHLRFEGNEDVEDLFARLDDTRFNLIVAGQRADVLSHATANDRLRVHAVAEGADNAVELRRIGVPAPAFYLLRPDGHVGLCGTRLDEQAILAYLTGPVGMRTLSAAAAT